MPPFLSFLVQVIRAHDSYGAWEGKSDDALLAPFVVDKEKRKTIPMIGDPDPKTIARFKYFHAALALAVEKRTGIMAAPLFDLSGEGFGRVVLIASRLVVISRHVRDIHRFGFLSLEALEEEAGKLVDQAETLIQRFPEVARL